MSCNLLAHVGNNYSHSNKASMHALHALRGGL
nr:MAG TPA: hypothetical protein [Caudoviricetes sp.]